MSSKDSGQKVTGTFTGKTTGNTASNTATVEESNEKKKSYDRLLSTLNAKGISLIEFSSVKENRRKKMLKDDYQEIKNESGWIYDEPIQLPVEVFEQEKDLNKKKAEAKPQ